MRTGSEIRDIFNLHYDNILSGASPGINDYEISLYLTQAHREIIYNYYSGNSKGDSFDSSEKIKAYLSHYIKTVQLTNLTELENPPTINLIYKNCVLNNDIWWLVRDDITSQTGERILVKPISYDDFWILVENPFKLPNDSRAWRLESSDEKGQRVITLVSNKEFTSYNITYISQPEVIIISNLEDILPGLTIEGKSEISLPNSLLSNDFLLDLVINRAVELATRDYKANDLNTQIQVNNRTE